MIVSKRFQLRVFRWIPSQTCRNDRRALLSIRDALCTEFGCYRYLEVGSHLGGSLQPHVVDRRCLSIVSIDPRPLEQPDERWPHIYRYEGNSTQRMVDRLATIPHANLSKLQTFELASWDLLPASISAPIDFAFIDGEHTNRAVLRDFDAVRRFLSASGIMAFHDCMVVFDALLRIRRALRREGVRHDFWCFPGSTVAAITFTERLSQRLLRDRWQQGMPFTHAIRDGDRQPPRGREGAPSNTGARHVVRRIPRER